MKETKNVVKNYTQTQLYIREIQDCVQFVVNILTYIFSRAIHDIAVFPGREKRRKKQMRRQLSKTNGLLSQVLHFK